MTNTKTREHGFHAFMIYVLMCSWLMRERYTYPRLDIAIGVNEKICQIANI